MNEAELKTILFDGLREIAPETEPEKSFDFLKFLIALNEKTGIEIPEADYGKLDTLDAMLRYLGPKV
jgi:acyl carrier protein